MKQTNNDVYVKAIQTFGEENQLFQLCEELAELIKAVNKWRRNKELANVYTAYLDDVTEEIADVEIMIDQVKLMLNIQEVELLDMKQKKIHRLAERLKNYDR